MLVIDVQPEILFERLVDAFRLSVGLGMVGRREVATDLEAFT